jgi:serine/threonine-protein kinase ULK4
MHKLSHAHILRFYDWYETRNNLWLILEYCTGGDLETILKQDGYLPEASIRIFGLDIIAGLKVSFFSQLFLSLQCFISFYY